METTEISKPKTIDPDSLGRGVYTEQVIIDETADAFAQPNPVDDGSYVFLITAPATDFIQTQTTKATEDRPAKSYIQINMKLKLESFLDADADNNLLKGKAKIFDFKVNSLTSEKDGKQVSKAATFLKYLGFDVPASFDADQLMATIRDAVRQGTYRIGGRTQWHAGWQKAGTDEGGKYGKWAVRGQKNFSKNPDGTFNPVVTVNKESVRANAKVVDIFPLI